MRTDQSPGRRSVWVLSGVGVLIGFVMAVLAEDVVLGVTVGAAFIAVTVGLVRLWAGAGDSRHPRHP